MPRFYISLKNGENVHDDTGQDLPDLEAARRAALKAAGQIIADDMARGQDAIRLTLVVTNDSEERLLVMPISLSCGEVEV